MSSAAPYSASIVEVVRSLTVAQRAVFAIFVGSMVFSLAGSLLLRFIPEVAGFVGAWYVTLVKAPTWTYMTLMPILAVMLYLPGEGAGRLIRFFLIGTVLGGLSELVGTTTGFPFGAYVYTEWLGPKAFGHVPLFIPPSWFAMSIVSYDLAGRFARGLTAQPSIGHERRPADGRLVRIGLTALLMVLWDVSLDPAMSRAFPFWTYPEGGFFYGMPLSNWLGWFAVAAAIATAFEFLAGGPVKAHPAALLFYAVNCAFPFLISLVFGLEGAFAIGALTTAAVWIAVSRRA